MHLNPEQPIQYLKSVGPKRASAFKEIGINSVNDLLHYFPLRYLDRSTILHSAQARSYVSGGFDGEVTLLATVVKTDLVRYKGNRKTILKINCRDESGFFDCVWFQGIKYFKDAFTEGMHIALSGKPVITKYGNLQFVHPDFDRIDQIETDEFRNTGKIIPYYSLPGKLKDTNIGSFSIRRIVKNAVDQYYRYVEENIPGDVIERNNLLHKSIAIKNLHYPESFEVLNKALHRIKFEEFFFLEILVALRKSLLDQKRTENIINFNTPLIKSFLNSLPYALTESQLSVLTQIRKDLESGKIMNRLLQGDVGCGKTIVAIISMLATVGCGYQAALMVPTEILASQHYITIHNLLKDFDLNVELLVGGQGKSIRNKVLDAIKTESRLIVIGTHALFEDVVEFKNLGLVIIDEQHRFGVMQRSTLSAKGNSPHLMVMTATPIPRTLTMSVYGDLDVSQITELPKHRIPIRTALRGEGKLSDIYKFIEERVLQKEQAFIIYPLVEESQKIDLKAAEEYFSCLRNSYFKDFNVGMLHGKMKIQEKEQIMESFNRGEYDILIATTVVEVGIDVPNATVILINDAHRFGLAQLHQLRGRVGRGKRQSYCILVTKDEYLRGGSYRNINLDYLSPAEREKFKSSIRLNSISKISDGFQLAEVDLKLRGPGDIFTTKQSGLPELKYANLVDDKDILFAAKDEAFNLVKNDPSLVKTENKHIKSHLLKYYSESLRLSLTP